MQIAIDGPAGAGKSTIAKQIAKTLNITYLDTGAMYRAITKGVIDRKIDFADQKAIAQYAASAVITFKGQRVFLDGEEVTEGIRTPEVSEHTSEVAPIPEVRKVLVQQQQRIAEGTDVIMDGRDIGSTVLPNADYKFYLDAAVSERAKRRYEELQEKGGTETMEQVLEDIRQRDYNDTHRELNPLRKAEDAIEVDSTDMSPQEVIDAIYRRIKDGQN